MDRNTSAARPALLGLASLLMMVACAVTSHPSQPARLGERSTLTAVEAAIGQSGPVVLETVTAADWQVPRAGLLNLEHPRAKHLKDEPENIHIYFHALRHPQRGLFIVDTGIARAVTDSDRSPFSWPLTAAMNLQALKVHVNTGDWLRRVGAPLRGVFLTHLHLDHVMGLPDVPHNVPIYTGPGEAEDKAFKHMFVKGTNDDLLGGRQPLRTWDFAKPASPTELAVVDVFGDASVFALHAPGHTPGSTAFVVRTTEGPVMLVGDACHTSFGWDSNVEPGTFSRDRQRSVESLQALRGLAERHPEMRVRLGHQPHQPHQRHIESALATGHQGINGR